MSTPSGERDILDICNMNHQISKIKSIQFDIICVYRSSDSGKINQINFLKDLNSLIHVNRKTFVLGDFNFNALSPEKNLILKELGNWDFIQMVKKPTHFQGGLIDHCYKSDNISTQSFSLNQKSVYYTDHDVNELIVTNI